MEALCRAAVIAALTALAFSLAISSDANSLWHDPYHDRNTHFLNGINLALTIRDFAPLGFMADATAVTVWPPLHAIALGLVLAAFGISPELAIVPSLIGWGATGLLAFFLAASWKSQTWAGAIAALLALSSPAWWLLGSDVMLEGLGAALSAFALLAFIRQAQSSQTGAAGQAARWTTILAVTLTALFFEKYNYYLMAVAAIVISAAWMDAGQSLRAGWRDPSVRRLLRGLLHPSIAFAAVLVALAIWFARAEPLNVTMFGRSFQFLPDHLLTAAYAIALLRLSLLWRRNRAELHARLGRTAVTLVHWHLVPVALWFLMPGVIRNFVWFVGPLNVHTNVYDPVAAAGFQWLGFADGFHVLRAAAVVVGLLGIAGATAAIRQGGAVRVVPIFAILSAALVILHPQQQWRFQATWLFAVWICSAWGLSLLTGFIWHQVFERRVGPRPQLRSILAAIGVAIIGSFLLAPAPGAQRAQAVAIRTPQWPDDRQTATGWLPAMMGETNVGFVSTLGVTDLFAWTVRQQCRCMVHVDQPWLQELPDRNAVRDAVAAWAASTSVAKIVFLDAPPPYRAPGSAGRSERLAGILDGLTAQRVFELERQDRMAGDRTVMVWARRADPQSPVPARPLRRHLLLVASLAAAGGVLLVLFGPSLARPRRML
jgi:hypothetical protein